MTGVSRPRMPGELRRAKLLELARRSFVTNGYHATTTRAIAEEAGISETLVLKHFKSKEELFRAAVVQPFFELLDRAGSKLEEYARTGRVLSLEDHFRVVLGFFSTWAAIVREERELIIALVSELRQFPDVAADLRVRTDRITHAWLPAPVAEAGLRDSDRSVSLLSGLAVATIAGWAADDPRAFLEEFFRGWYVGLLTEAGQRRLLKSATQARGAGLSRRQAD